MKKSDIVILMADDDEEDRMLLKDAFEDLGHGGLIHFEENGEKALQYLNRCLENNFIPCLVVLDLNMPRLNGRQTLQHIKSNERMRGMQVVIFSTSLNPIERDECLALGAHSYVVKPISYKESVQIAENFYALCQNISLVL